MHFRESQVSEPATKSVRINKNENEKPMVKGNYNSAQKDLKMEFSMA